MRRYKFIIYISILSFIACNYEKEIDYDIHFSEENIVVYAIASPNDFYSEIFLSVSPINQENIPEKKEFTVIILEHGNNLCTLKTNDNQKYYLPDGIKLNQNNFYSIAVSAPGFKTVYSADQLLPETILIDTTYIQRLNSQDYLIFRITDPQHRDNYYAYRIQYLYNGNIVDINNNYLLCFYHTFNDEGIDGNEIEQKIKVSFENYSEGTKYDSLLLKVYSINEDIILLMESLEAYDATLGDPWYEKTAPIFTNITNGFGFFACYSYDSVYVKP